MSPDDDKRLRNNVSLFIEDDGARFLRMVAIFVGFAGLIAELGFYRETGTVVVAGGAASVVLAVVMGILLQVGRPQAALLAMMWGFILVPLVGGLRWGGLAAPALVTLPLTALIGGFLFSRRRAIELGVGVLISLAVLYVMKRFGYSASYPTSESLRALTYGSVSVLSLVVGMRFALVFRRQYRMALELSATLSRQLQRTEESEERFVKLFRAMPLPALVGDIDGVVTDVNDSWVTSFGINRDIAIGKNQTELGVWANAEQQDAIKARLLSDGGVRAQPVDAIIAGGEQRHFLLSVALIERDGCTSYIALMLDQTDRIRAEAAQQALNCQLEAMVATRTSELNRAMDTLQRTQNELIQYGTLASLGSMVAGISHELNTPIGNALTVASTLQEQVAKVADTVASGTVKRSTLDSFFSSGREMAALIVKSIQRAAELIASFKQVAVDQTSERRRVFDLFEVVDDVITTLRPGLKTTPWLIEMDIPAGISCDSFPGPLGQVVTNLVQNAVTHGFEGKTAGRVLISAQVQRVEWERESQRERICLRIRDDGHGMAPATLTHVFEPFFTTRLGKGGSGLGLSVCHRIATTVLGGEMSVESALGQGTCFSLTFPAVAPGRI